MRLQAGGHERMATVKRNMEVFQERVLADFDSQVIPMGERSMVTTGDSNDRLQIANDARYLRVGTPDMSAAMKNTR